MSDLFSVALQAALAMEGILFAAFGFLYAAYCQYSSLPTPAHPLRAPVANKLATACRLTCVVITINAVLAIYVLVRTVLFANVDGFILGLGFIVTIVAVVGIGWFLAAAM